MGKLDAIKLQPHARAQVLRGLRIWNATGATIAAGALVYVSGWSQTFKRWLVTLADADVIARGNAIFIVRHAILKTQGGVGWKTHRLQGVDTDAGSVSDPVYLSATAGGWTLTAPSVAGGQDQIVGRIAVDSATVGEIEFNLELSPTGGGSGGGEFVSRLTVGAIVAGTPEEVGAGAGNFLGLQMAFQNAGTTLSRLTGMQIDVDDTSTHSNTIACARFYSEKVSGTGSNEHWGIMAQNTITAGKVNNSVAGMFILTVKGSSVMGTDGGSFRAFAVAGDVDLSGAGDYATSPDMITGAIIGTQIGHTGNSATGQKLTGIIVAQMGGDTKAITCGAFFKAVRKNSIAGSKADYGLDLYYDESGAYIENIFAVGDIRLGGLIGPVIMQGTADPNGSITRPKGSLHLDTTNGALKINTDGGTTWAATG